jgi:dihydrofolate reductase
MIKPLICAIAAMDKNRGIGIKNEIPWDIPEDMKYLREVTNGMPLIMGSKTYESICSSRSKYSGRDIDGQIERAMPGRLNVVVSRNKDYFPNGAPEGVMLATTPEEGLKLAYEFASANMIDKVFVFGGSQIYEALIAKVDILYLTHINHAFNCDAKFPEWDKSQWKLVSSEPRDNGSYEFEFNVYQRLSL